ARRRFVDERGRLLGRVVESRSAAGDVVYSRRRASDSPRVQRAAPSSTTSLSRNWPGRTEIAGKPPSDTSQTPGVVTRKLSVVANMPTARALPRAEARVASGRRAINTAIVTSATPTRLENARTPRAVAAQAIRGLCAASGRMASASTGVNFIRPIQ